MEGAPAFLMGIVTYFYLTERPENAEWLTIEQKKWLISALREERESKKNVKNLSTLKAMSDPKVLFLSFIYFVYQTGSLSVGYWMPQIIKGFSKTVTNTQIGLIAMIPYIVATIGMIYWSRRSDVKGERRMHSAIPLLVAGIGLIGAGITKNPYLSIALISISLTGMYSFKSPFWALPSLFLTQSSAAVAIAAINSIGNLSGFVGPYAVGALKGATGSTKTGLIFLSALLFISFIMVLSMRIEKTNNSSENESLEQTI